MENGIRKKVLAAVPVSFTGKDGKQVEMVELYLQADDGRLGSVFVTFAAVPGDDVLLLTEVKDGRVKLRVKKADGPISNRA